MVIELLAIGGVRLGGSAVSTAVNFLVIRKMERKARVCNCGGRHVRVGANKK